MATVLENDASGPRSLEVDEHGILWNGNHGNAQSPGHVTRNRHRHHPSLGSQDQELIASWNRNVENALKDENKQLRVCTRIHMESSLL